MARALDGFAYAFTAVLIGCAASRTPDTAPALDEPVQGHDAAAVADESTDAATSMPAEGYELVSIQGCEREQVPQGFPIVPLAICSGSPNEPGRFICSTDASIECLRASDCTAQPFGRCEGNAASQCNYPHVGSTCVTGSDCTELPDGVCMPAFVNGVFCDADGNNCHPQEASCHYLPLNQGCTTDAECTAAPGGFCQREIRSTRCIYFGCEDNGDCEAGERCACHTCVAAECESDAECGAGELCRQENNCGWGPNGGFHCTKPADECASDDDCPEGYCNFDSASSRFACSAQWCEVP